MKKLLLTLLLTLIPLGLMAQDLRIETPSDTLKAKPGESLTLPFVVYGSGGTYNAELDVPDQWHPMMFSERFEFTGEKHTELLMVRLPSTALKGTHDVQYTVNGVSENASRTITVQVPEVREITASLQRDKTVAISGDTLTSVLTITNNSNVPVEVDLSTYESFSETEGIDGTISLEPNEVREITGITKTDVKMDRARDHYFRVDVTDRETDTQISRADVRTEVLPLSRDTGLEYHRYPLEFGTHAMYQERENDGSFYNQMWLSGDGTLREDGRTNVEFMLKSPPLRDFDEFEENAYTVFPMWSEYYVSVSQPTWKVDLGDRYFRTSELTGENAYGFGAGAEYASDWEVGAFYTQTRRSRRDREQAGGHLGYNFNDRYYVGTNVGWLDDELYDGTAVSAETRMSPTEITEFEGEASVDQDNDQTGYSYRAKAKVGTSNAYVSAEYEDFSDQNPSWNRGSTRYNATALARRWNTTFIGSYYHNDSDFFGSYSDDTYRFDVSRKRIGAFYEYGDNEYSGSVFNRHVKEHSVGGDTRVGGKRLYATARTEFSWFDYLNDPTVDEWKRQERYRASVNFRDGGFRSRVGSYYRTGAQQFRPEGRDQVGIDGSVDYEWNRNQVGASASGQYYDNGFSDWSYYYRAYAEHELVQGTRFRAEGIYRDFFRDEWGVRATAIVPIGVPMHKSQKSGMVFGSVTDASGESISGAAVYVNGSAAVSNENGMYYIGGQEPGTYNVYMNPTELGVNKIVRNTDDPVAINAAEKTRRDITVVDGVGIRGMIQFEDGSPAKDMIVEVSDGEQSFRRITDGSGELQFTALPPGSWNLRLVDELNDYTSDDSYREFELEPGETGSFTITVKRERDINFVNDTEEEVVKTDTSETDVKFDPDKFKKYTVQEGDWLSKIAREEYGDMFKWPVIYDENMDQIKDPDLIYPGQVIIVPIIK